MGFPSAFYPEIDTPAISQNDKSMRSQGQCCNKLEKSAIHKNRELEN